jgi:hypothetical protein
MLNCPLVYVVVKNKNKNAEIVPNACSFLLSDRSAPLLVWCGAIGCGNNNRLPCFSLHGARARKPRRQPSTSYSVSSSTHIVMPYPKCGCHQQPATRELMSKDAVPTTAEMGRTSSSSSETSATREMAGARGGAARTLRQDEIG